MKKLIIVLATVGIIFAGFSIFFVYSLDSVSSDSTSKNFVISQGEGLSSISLHLQNENLVRNRYVFMAMVYHSGLNGKLQAGLFKLSSSLTTPEIITKLSKGGSQDYWLKIIEGQRLAELSVKFDSSLEGFIYPDSYLIPQDYQPAQIYKDIIKKNFDEKLAEAKVGATNTQMTDAEIVTLASILEREARTLPSKQMVAGILLNRLNIGMALQLDTTVEYARDSKLPHPKTYWQEASAADVHIVSTYNTYLHPGLPPGPICNPGYDSLYAALHPTASDYTYYLTGNDNLMHYATTLKDHNSNIAKYLKN